ncbi:aspartate/glutamate racemase family protein [Saccharopolyspora spinosa]|uniref:Aspartate racemase n=1 Tax=Saccharopolyspora spinosa TaxID=60894 RepID=A0A2N3Y189_SACSN|nr:amino acid racemase [Saccharopolyspora spinosa]PKW16679.1 aspartate racemase [Saccharopolyspora spinosa]
MKTIGVVSGIAWPSSMIYYRVINEAVSRRLGGNGLHCADLVMAQNDFEQVELHQRIDRWDVVGELLAEQGRRLKAAGADFFLLACNTVHVAGDIVENGVDLPFLHIVDPTGEQLIRQGIRTVGLLGSRYTMTGTYFVDRLKQRYGMEVLIAEDEHQDNVHNALYQELAKGVFLDQTRDKFRAAIADLAARGAEAVVLGCTEFGMLVSQEDSPVPLLDTTVVHAEAAVEMAFADEPAVEDAIMAVPK